MPELDELRRKVDELASREEIRDVLYRYTRYIDRLDAEGVKQGYHPDADDIHWGTFIGNAHAFADYMVGELRAVKYLIHEVTNPLVELDGERAFVESRYTSRVRIDFEGAEEGQWVESIAHGRYLDIFERRAGQWKIAHRRIVQDGGRTSIVNDLGHYRPEAVGGQIPDDPVYKRFGIVDIAPPPLEGVKGRFDGLREFGKRAAAAQRAGS